MRCSAVLAATGIALLLAANAVFAPHSERAQTRVLLRNLTATDEFVSEALTSFDNHWIAVRVSKIPQDARNRAHEGRTIVFDSHTQSSRQIEEGQYYNSMCFSSTSTCLFLLNGRGRIDEYDLTGGGRRIVMEDLRRHIQTQGAFTAASADGTLIAVSHSLIIDPKVYAVDVTTGEAIEFREGDYYWTGATISRNGRLIATGGWPGWSPRIYDRKAGEWVGYCLHAKYAGPNCVAFSPDARYLACTYPDGTLVLFDLTTARGWGAEQVVTLPGFETVSCLSFDSSGRRLVCGLLDGAVELRRIEIPEQH